MAQLVPAIGLGPIGRKPVGVRVPPLAQHGAHAALAMLDAEVARVQMERRLSAQACAGRALHFAGSTRSAFVVLDDNVVDGISSNGCEKRVAPRHGLLQQERLDDVSSEYRRSP